MPDPSKVAGLGQAATASGSVLGAFGSIDKGIAGYEQSQYQAAIARINERIEKQNAAWTMQTAEQENMKEGMAKGIQLGQIKAAQASSGFDVRSGSGAAYRQSVLGMHRTDMAITRSNYAKQAYNFETQGVMAGAQAQLDTMAGTNELLAGGVGATSSLLGGAASVSNQWLQAQKMGVYGGGSDIAGSSWLPPVYGGSTP